MCLCVIIIIVSIYPIEDTELLIYVVALKKSNLEKFSQYLFRFF